MKYHIITYGCQMNESDSERLAGQLEKDGCRPTDSPERANLIILNVCSVRQSAVNRVYDKIKKLRRENPRAKIILTGCILENDRKKFRPLADEIWPAPRLSIKPKCRPAPEAFLPIMTGCNNFCSYCVVPYTRGREKSRPAQEIIKQAKALIKQGYKKIVLIGQNVNSYKDKKNAFPQLLEKISDLAGNFELSFLTSHPKDISDELIKVISQEKKISKEIHLPVQSGDNQILKKMNRGYTVEKYLTLIKKIKQKIPGARISTDIIVGFPGETKKQFKNTVGLFKKAGFSYAYVACYSPRAGTAAAKLKDNVLWSEKKIRQRTLLKTTN